MLQAALCGLPHKPAKASAVCGLPRAPEKSFAAHVDAGRAERRRTTCILSSRLREMKIFGCYIRSMSEGIFNTNKKQIIYLIWKL